MTKPTISIVIPAYNAALCLPETIHAIQQQTFSNWELIIVDDCSTDQTYKIICDLAHKDQRIVSHKLESNQGASGARNAGIALARGQYMVFLDADDTIKPNYLSTLLNNMTPNCDLAVCGFIYRQWHNHKITNEEIIGLTSLPDKPSTMPFAVYVVYLLGISPLLYQVWNKLYRRDIIHRYKLQFPINLNFGEDLEFNLSYLHYAKQIKFIKAAPYVYNLRDTGTYKKSSLIYKHRIHNYRAVQNLVKHTDHPQLKDYLQWLQYYWFYSFCLAINLLPRKQRYDKLTNALEQTNFHYIPKRNVIGLKRWLLSTLICQLSHQPHLLSLFIDLSNGIKKCALTAWLWRTLKRS